jgi:hypothetical protein
MFLVTLGAYTHLLMVFFGKCQRGGQESEGVTRAEILPGPFHAI